MKTAVFLFLLFCLTFCGYSQGFKKLTPTASGINFANTISENDTINGLSYLYLYNGGGVAIGDINNDGLEDIYFTGNQVDDKLYLNLGDMKFKDVTKKYFKDQRFDFHTGATMVDINNDGWLDIYVSCAGYAYDGEDRRNKLFINQKGKKFIDQAKEYGLDDSLNTTQAAFFDADNDGDLDVYLLNHVYLRKNTQYWFQFNKMQKVLGHDKLMMNDNGHFYDRSESMGINSDQYGQGVIISDFNQDGWQDIYVANDFESSDKLYMNKGSGGFEESILTKTKHIPFFSMGVDAADINNDGLIDIMGVDMASEDHVTSKKNMGGMNADKFWKLVTQKEHYQYMFNTLQLNLGDEFIDIGLLAGVAKTDWSWAPLFADFDNDGFQDLYVSNGYLRDLRNSDFTNKYDRNIQLSRQFTPFDELQKLIPSSKTPNYIFKNNGDLTFSKKSQDWGLEEPINVNGAAYADLDNDGDLDMICNAGGAPSFVLENKSSGQNFLKVKLNGAAKNRNAIGAKIELYQDNQLQVREIQPSRGFQSSVSTTVHFGLGALSKVDSVLVRFNGIVVFKQSEISSNQTVTIDIAPQKGLAQNYLKTSQILTEVSIPVLKIKHSELNHDDFEKEVLLPHKMSELGPFITVGDINEDGLDDFYIGAARGSKGALMIQNENGEFIEKPLELFKTNYLSEEMQSLFFDADNDGDLDIYIVMGSNESPKNDASYIDQLYINDGEENFALSKDALPQVSVSGQKVLAEDLNNDGWLDLIVFGRQEAQNYPAPPSSFIYINEKGKFIDKTDVFAPEFYKMGMVTDAIFINIDSDKNKELIIVGEWMPITIFDFQQGVYKNITAESGLQNTVGWWNTIELIESQSGIHKFALGNLGLNNKYHPSEDNPLHIYLNDFDDNGTNDIVLAKAQDAILYPVRGRSCSSQQMPFIAQKFESYDLFAKADVESIYTAEKLNNALHFEAQTFANSFLTIRDGKFKIDEMPKRYQTGPINSILIDDFDNDDQIDMFCFGNKYEAEVETIRYDGNPSIFYKNGTDINYPEYLSILANIKSAKAIEIKGETYILLGINNGVMQIYKVKR